MCTNEKLSWLLRKHVPTKTVRIVLGGHWAVFRTITENDFESCWHTAAHELMS